MKNNYMAFGSMYRCNPCFFNKKFTKERYRKEFLSSKELKELMKEGVGQKGLPNNQQYNQGGTLKEKPEVK